MLLEDLYNIDMLEEFQRYLYQRVVLVMHPIDESLLNHYRTHSLVLFDTGGTYLEIIITPAAANGFPITLTIYPRRVLLQMAGLRSEYVRDEANATDATIIDDIGATLENAFAGRTKIIEHRAGQHAYWWIRYDIRDSQWQQHAEHKRKLYNYLGKKTSVELHCRLY